MKSLLAAFLLVSATWVQAQSTTPNLINPAGTAWGIPSNQVLNTAGITAVEGLGPTTGTAYYNSDTNTIRFSYMPSTVSQTIAINSVLSGLGIQVRGFNWSYQWMNGGQSIGSLSSTVAMTNSQGTTVEQYQWSHSATETAQWQTNAGTKSFTNPYDLSTVGTISMSFTGQDSLFWNGLYGPRVRNPSLSLNYGVDTCTLNPLSSPECPGYAAAYLTQQCSISSLYSPSCPGYAAALLAQQCAANALYDPSCPGYQQAYFNYRCEQDGLYSQSCPNYVQAYARNQLLTTAPTESTPATATTSTTTAAQPQATSTTSPTSVTSVTSVIVPAAPVIVQPPTGTTAVSTANTAETRRVEAEVRSTTAGTSGSTARARTESRAREVAAAATSAATIEAQAATQGLQIGLMAFVPGFDAYTSARIQDVNAVALQRQYGRQPVDNRSLLRQLSSASDRLHQEMVDQQWR